MTLGERFQSTVALAGLLILVGCGGGAEFPENQRMPGTVEVTTDWQEITFDSPLEVNRDGVQSLHFVVDGERYTPNSSHDIEDHRNHFNLRRDDGALVKPDVVFIAGNGEKVRVRPVINLILNDGRLTTGFGTYAGQYASPPPFPDNVESFQAVRFRSNEPFTAEELRWRVDVHPELHECGGQRCPLWRRILDW